MPAVAFVADPPRNDVRRAGCDFVVTPRAAIGLRRCLAADRANQRYPLLFRDYLRAHPRSAAAYAELKRRLVDNLRDPDSYPDVKDPACDLIIVAAEDWAAAIGWRLGPSDA